MNTLDPQIQAIFLELLLNRDDSQTLQDCVRHLLQAIIVPLSKEGIAFIDLTLALQHYWMRVDSKGVCTVGPELASTVEGTLKQSAGGDGLEMVHQSHFNLASGSQGWFRIYKASTEAPESSDRQESRQKYLEKWCELVQKISHCLWAQELQERYVALMDASVDAIITIDRAGTIMQFSCGAEALFGYKADEVVGRSVNLLMPLPYSHEHDQYVDRYVTTGKAKIIGIGRRVPARRKDGSIFPAHLAVSEFQRHGHRYFVGILTDISEFVEARSRAIVEERRHLSRELHDSVSQALFGIVLGAQTVKNALEPQSQAHEGIDYVLSLAESGLAEMRTLIFELRPESLESQGLISCLTLQSTALARRYQIEIDLRGDLGEPNMALPFKHEVYRIVMESLHNVVKHARAQNCAVTFEHEPGHYKVSVSDDGQGFVVDKVSPHKVGLSSMRERVAQLGGLFRIESQPGQGSKILAIFPTNYQGGSDH